MKITKTKEFEKDEKQLAKKHNSISDDIENFKKSFLIPYFDNKDNVPHNNMVKIEGSCGEKYDSYKVKHFRCKSLEGKGCRSGIRITLIHVHVKEKEEVLLVEIYLKSNKKNEDKKRLKKYSNP